LKRFGHEQANDDEDADRRTCSPISRTKPRATLQISRGAMGSAMKPSTQRVHLVRHGETAWTLSKRHTGLTDIPLTQAGRAMAQRLRPVLAREDFALVLSSPLLRARETSQLAGFAEVAAIDSDLCEWNYGEYEGLTTGQIRAQTPEWTVFCDGCPGGESPEQVGSRADRVIAKVRDVRGHVLLFAHGHILRVIVARWLGLPPTSGRHFLLDTATLSTLTYYRGVPALKRWNASL